MLLTVQIKAFPARQTFMTDALHGCRWCRADPRDMGFSLNNVVKLATRRVEWGELTIKVIVLECSKVTCLLPTAHGSSFRLSNGGIVNAGFQSKVASLHCCHLMHSIKSRYTCLHFKLSLDTAVRLIFDVPKLNSHLLWLGLCNL